MVLKTTNMCEMNHLNSMVFARASKRAFEAPVEASDAVPDLDPGVVVLEKVPVVVPVAPTLTPVVALLAGFLVSDAAEAKVWLLKESLAGFTMIGRVIKERAIAG